MSLPNSQKGFAPIIIVAIIAALLAAGFFFVSKNKSIPGNNIIPQINQSPYDKLQNALTKTNAATTAYLDYKTKVTSRITLTSGVTKTLVNNVDGYLTGSTDGKTAKYELRISTQENPNSSIIIDGIAVEGGDQYIKGPATKGKWQKLTKLESEALNDKTPTDASLYGFEILGTIFSEDKSLFKAIKKETVQKLPEAVEGDKKLERYEVEVSVIDFVNALKQNKDKTEKNIKDAEMILKDATLKTTYTVDPSTGYVVKLLVEARNLTQLLAPEAAQLGISAEQHDMELTGDLSRFDVPTGISIPDASEILAPTSKI